LVLIISNFMGLLLATPGSPDQEAGPFYLIKGLLKVVADYPWEKNFAGRFKVQMNLLALFAAFFQPKFEYHIPGVESNDLLYGGDSDYTNEAQGIISKVLEDLLSELAKLKQEEETDPNVMK